MIKKLIPISVILALAISLGLVGVAKAGYDDVIFSADTSIGVGDLVVSSGSRVVSIVVGASTVTITSDTASGITFTSAAGNIMELDNSAAGVNVCNADGTSTLTVSYVLSDAEVVLSLPGGTCSGTGLPTVSTVVVASTTTVTVTMSEKINYVAGKTSTDLLAGTTFAGLTPTAVSTINGTSASFTLTFAAGALAGAGVKDNSVLVLPAAVLEDTDGNDFAGTSNKVVTTLLSINQLYDFVFVIQTGQNFMSIPYDVVGPDGTAVNTAAKVALTYVVPNGAIYTYTISDAGGAFGNAASFAPLYGYYITSTATSDVYLRLNKASTQSSVFERTMTATGWHLIGVASNNVATAINSDTDDDVLSSLAGTTNLIPPYYDRVVDIAVGRAGDDNANASPDYTYDATVSCYKALLNNLYIVTKTKAQIDSDTLVGIEFNHGEAYFIYILMGNAKYIGEKVNTGNLVL